MRQQMSFYRANTSVASKLTARARDLDITYNQLLGIDKEPGSRLDATVRLVPATGYGCSSLLR